MILECYTHSHTQYLEGVEMNTERMLIDANHAEAVKMVLDYLELNRERLTRPWPETSFPRPELYIETEVPYNYYGSRGFVDIVEYRKNAFISSSELDRTRFHPGDILTLWEIKSALRNIGETLRQMHQAQKIFLLANRTIGNKSFNDRRIDVYSALAFPNTDLNLTVFNAHKVLFQDHTSIIYTIDKETPHSLKTLMICGREAQT